MKEFFEERINTVHMLIDEGMYDKAIEMMHTLKYRIVDGKLLQDIDTKLNTIDTNYNNEINSLPSDPIKNYTETQKAQIKRSRKYLAVFTSTLEEYGI